MTADVQDGLPEADYFAQHDALSASGAKALISTCPARFRYDQQHPPAPKAAFDFGHAVHSMVLTVGAPIGVVDATDWRTKAAKDERDVLRELGKIPMLSGDYIAAMACADAVAAHPIAAALFADGTPERSLRWHDKTHGVDRRARLDWITQRNGRTIVVDLKTCLSADPAEIARAVAKYRYHQQAAWYLDGIRACGLGDEPAFLFVFVEKERPHLVTVVELDGDAIEQGDRDNQRALATFAQCLRTDTWPGYTDADDIPIISLPAWAYTSQETQ